MANGTIAFDTLQTSGQITGTAKSVDTDYVVNGSAKAFYRGTSDITIEKSLNIDSGTDNGTGNFTYNFTNNMSDTAYAPICSAYSGVDKIVTLSSPATSSMTMEMFTANTGANVDGTTKSAVFGDLA